MTAKQLKIAIAGAGGLGSLFGGLLTDQAQVTLIARGARVAKLREEGVVIHYDGDRTTRFPRVVDSGQPGELEALADIDYLLFCCKSQDTVDLAEKLLPHTGATTHIVSLQNGVDNENRLEELFGRSVIGAMTVRFGAHLNDQGEVDLVGELITRIGEHPTGLSARITPLVEVLNSAGFSASEANDIRHESWKKMIINCACNPVTALLEGDIPTLYSSPSSRWLMQNMMREAAAAAGADGVEISPTELEQLAVALESMPPLKSSMQVDAARGTPLELGGLTGAIMRRAAAQGQEALVTTTVHQLLVSKYPGAAV